MPRICYASKRFSDGSLEIIDRANQIITDYAAQGFDLTLRQLYYQFVSRDLIPNKMQEYKRLGSIINDARLAGMVDWGAIVDRTRNLRQQPHWESPADIVDAVARQFRVDKWVNQDVRPECFSPDTPVLTRQGFVPLGAIQVGDEVLTHEGRFRSVTKVIRNLYEGNMVRLTAAGLLPVLVTPNHPLYARSHDDALKYKGAERQFHQKGWVDAGTLKKFDRLLLPKLQRDTFHPPATLLEGGPRSKKIEIAFDDLTWRMIGLYLAEGSIRPDGRTVQFTVGAHERAHANVVERWGDCYGVNHHTVPGAGTLIVYLYSKALADWLTEHFGNGAFHKRLPSWFMEAPSGVQMPLLEYYFRGDGCFWDESRGAMAVTSRSQDLARQVQILLLWAGFASALDTMLDHDEPRYRVSVGGVAAVRLADLWHVEIPEKGLGRSRRYNHIQATEAGPFIEFPVRSITLEPYKGEVINLEVEEDHSYCVPFIAHNCWIEKDALSGVIEGVCNRNDVPFFSCRGYTSQSEMWAAAQRLIGYIDNGQTPLIIHLGDHDRSPKW
jgi:hypothetical protein